MQLGVWNPQSTTRSTRHRRSIMSSEVWKKAEKRFLMTTNSVSRGCGGGGSGGGSYSCTGATGEWQLRLWRGNGPKESLLRASRKAYECFALLASRTLPQASMT